MLSLTGLHDQFVVRFGPPGWREERETRWGLCFRETWMLPDGTELYLDEGPAQHAVLGWYRQAYLRITPPKGQDDDATDVEVIEQKNEPSQCTVHPTNAIQPIGVLVALRNPST